MTTFVRTAYHQQKMLELEKEITRLRQRVAELEREVDYLRRYGNKDCTAMADAAMEADK